MPQTTHLLMDLIEQGESRPEIPANKNFLLLDAMPEQIELYAPFASRPPAGWKGRVFWSSDTGQAFYDDGTQWVTLTIGTGGSLSDHNHTALGDGGPLTNPLFDASARLARIATPAAAATGELKLFADQTTGHLSQIDQSGVVIDLAAGGGGGDHNHTAPGDGGTLSGALVDTHLDVAHLAVAPAGPGATSDRNRLYALQDGRLYTKPEDGVQRRVDLRTASELAFAPTGTIAATDVQAAIAELESEKMGPHGHPATAITNTPSGNIGATDVQGAINELDTEKASVSHPHLASGITFTPAGNIAATNVQAAIQEVDTEKIATTNGVGTGLRLTDSLTLDVQPTAPATPAAGQGRVYILQSDKHIYLKDDTGTTTDLGLIGGSGLSAHDHTGSADGGVLTNPRFDGYLDINEIAPPGSPGAGTNRGRLYPKADGHLYWIDQDNNEFDLTATGGASVWTSSGGVIYPTTLTDVLSLGSLSPTTHKLHIVQTGDLGNATTPRTPLFIDQSLTAIDVSVGGAGPDVGQINTLVNYLATSASIANADVTNTGIDSRIIYGAAGQAARGTVHNYTFTNRVVNSQSFANEMAGVMGWLRAEGNPGTNCSLWGTDISVHGPVNTQPGALMGVTQFMGNYFNGSPSRCISHGMAVVTAPGTGAGSEPWPGSGVGHANFTNYPIDVAFVGTGRSTGGTGNIGIKTVFRAGGAATPWFASGTAAIERGLWISDCTVEGILLTGANHDIAWGPVGDPNRASLGSPGSNFVQVNERLRVKSTQSINDPLIDAGNSVTQSNSINLWNANGSLSFFVSGGAGNFLPGTAIGDVGLRSSVGRFLLGKDGVTNPYMVVDAGRVGIGLGTAMPNNAAILQVGSSIGAQFRGVLFSPMTAAQFDSIPSKPAGLGAYISDLNKYQIFDGTSRVDWGGSSGGGAPASHNHTSAANDGGVLTNDMHDGYIEMVEIAVPAAPPTNSLRLYPRDVSGSTRLFYQDSGAMEFPASIAPAKDHTLTTVTWDPASLPPLQWESFNVTVAGAQLGDMANASFATPLPDGVVMYLPTVTGLNQVKVTIQNLTTGTVDLASNSLRLSLWRYV